MSEQSENQIKALKIVRAIAGILTLIAAAVTGYLGSKDGSGPMLKYISLSLVIFGLVEYGLLSLLIKIKLK